jgi:hypothetical protein
MRSVPNFAGIRTEGIAMTETIATNVASEPSETQVWHRPVVTTISLCQTLLDGGSGVDAVGQFSS